MTTKRGVLAGIGGTCAFLAVIGAAQDFVNSTNADVHAAVATPIPAPVPAIRTVVQTQTVTVKTPAPMPPVCVDLVHQVDAMTQSVLDYDSSVSQAQSAEEAGAAALAGHDQAALSRARSKLNDILNNSVGPMQDLFAAQPQLKKAQAACKKALGG